MGEYNKFEDFVIAVISEAEKKSQRKYNIGLDKLFRVTNSNVLDSVLSIICKGWHVYSSVATSLKLSPAIFGVTLSAFLISPIGLTVAASLIGGGISGMKLLYQDRNFVEAIKGIGADYKDDFENHTNETIYINDLINKASNDLIYNAENNIR